MKRKFEMIGIMLVFGIIGISCDNGTTGLTGGTTGGTSGSKTVTIKYQLSGTITEVDYIMYRNSSGGYDSLNNVTPPWEKSFSVTIDKGGYFSASIAGSSYTSGSLTAKIFVNGTEIKSVNSSGDTYFTVTAVEIIRN
jgi:hypothetical protein